MVLLYEPGIIAVAGCRVIRIEAYAQRLVLDVGQNLRNEGTGALSRGIRTVVAKAAVMAQLAQGGEVVLMAASVGIATRRLLESETHCVWGIVELQVA